MTKTCSRCGKEYPMTTEFFQRDSSTQDGHKYACKICIKTGYHSQKKEAFCKTCGANVGIGRREYCEPCFKARRRKQQKDWLYRTKVGQPEGTYHVPSEVWARLTLAMIEKCEVRGELLKEYEWCWDCTANYFCQNTTLDLTMLTAS